MAKEKLKVALVFGNLPTVEEIDQFRLVRDTMEVDVVTSESISGYLSQTSRFQDLKCIALPDHNESPTFLPGLESVLAGYDVVLIKERLGLCAFQAVKAKWKHRFRLAVWVDNLCPYPGEDITQMRTIRQEVDNAADVYLVQTEAARHTLLLEGIKPERITSFAAWGEERVTRNKKTKASALAAMRLPETSFVVAHVGQVEWEENVLDLVHAIKHVKRTNPKFADRLRIVFCGIGSYSGQLRQALITHGVDEHATFIAPARQAFEAILEAADCLYFAPMPARDRVEGDPYRIITAAANGIPVLASRTTMIEELVGKHRFDFCSGSPESLASAIEKVSDATALRNDIVKKNLATLKSQNSADKVTKQMVAVLTELAKQTPSADPNAIDHQVAEVESRVSSKQYLAAIDLIESIFQLPDLAVHHKANLYRLIGDCFAKLGDNEAAKDAYIKAIEADSFSAKAFIGLGTVSLVKGSNDIAVIHFQKAVSLAPEDEMANLGLGLSFLGMEELKEANRWVVKSLQINAENTAALFTLVKIAHELEMYDDAERALARYVQLHPNDHNMIYTLAGVAFKQRRYDMVAEMMNGIIAIDPMDARAHSLLKQAKRGADQKVANS
jgi:glycosyltransferase involved in cell wall biosynthesis/Tfp pilus assembly protein PilF